MSKIPAKTIKMAVAALLCVGACLTIFSMSASIGLLGTLPSPWKPTFLNGYILEITSEYEALNGFTVIDASRDPSSFGVTRRIVYQNRVVATPDDNNGVYCVGLLFDVYMRACEEAVGSEHFKIPRISSTNVAHFRREFYGADGDRRTFVGALTQRKLGVEILHWDDALPGDFVQIWRERTGHSAIFLRWTRNDQNEITGLVYWGTSRQKIGVGEETIGPGGIQELHLVRAYTP